MGYLLYLGFAAIVALATLSERRTREARDCDQFPDLDDPYLIAFLRGGVAAAVDLAVASLVDRGVLAARRRDQVVWALASAAPPSCHELERAIFSWVARDDRRWSNVRELYNDRVVLDWQAAARSQLREAGLLVSEADVRARAVRGVASAIAVLLVGTAWAYWTDDFSMVGIVEAIGLEGLVVLWAGPACVPLLFAIDRERTLCGARALRLLQALVPAQGLSGDRDALPGERLLHHAIHGLPETDDVRAS